MKRKTERLHEAREELMDMIVLGQVERITARHGEYLQIRPKAANAKALTEAIGPGRTDSDAATRLLFEEEFHQCTTGPSFSDPVAIALTCRFPGISFTASFFWQGFLDVICMDNRS